MIFLGSCHLLRTKAWTLVADAAVSRDSRIGHAVNGRKPTEAPDHRAWGSVQPQPVFDRADLWLVIRPNVMMPQFRSRGNAITWSTCEGAGRGLQLLGAADRYKPWSSVGQA